jgi:hypothetical protein
MYGSARLARPAKKKEGVAYWSMAALGDLEWNGIQS